MGRGSAVLTEGFFAWFVVWGGVLQGATLAERRSG